jgi:hypothetical protein
MSRNRIKNLTSVNTAQDIRNIGYNLSAMIKTDPIESEVRNRSRLGYNDITILHEMIGHLRNEDETTQLRICNLINSIEAEGIPRQVIVYHLQNMLQTEFIYDTKDVKSIKEISALLQNNSLTLILDEIKRKPTKINQEAKDFFKEHGLDEYAIKSL